jgi:hypothetical protein
MGTAAIGVMGTLSAALLTQVLARRAESGRRRADDRDRWLAERLRVNSHLLSRALGVERSLWSVCSFLSREGTGLDDCMSLWTIPEDEPPDAETREILMEALYEADEALDDLEDTAAEVALIGTASEAAAARSLLERLWDVWGLLECYGPFDEAANAVERCRTARDQFAKAARESLRVDGDLVPHDGRPRRDDGGYPFSTRDAAET